MSAGRSLHITPRRRDDADAAVTLVTGRAWALLSRSRPRAGPEVMLCFADISTRCANSGSAPMPTIRLDEGLFVHCAVDDYLWPWEASTPVLMMHGFARNATFWNRWVPAIAESRRIYRPDLLGCG